MVIRNAKQLMNGLTVGAWNSKVDPDRVIKEVIEKCEILLASDALHSQPPSKKRKKAAEGVQSNVPDSVRSSKRLRKAASGKSAQVF